MAGGLWRNFPASDLHAFVNASIMAFGTVLPGS